MKTDNSPRRAALPVHQPGVVTKVSLEDLPRYLLANGLQLMDPGECRSYELAHGTRRPDNLLWVRRTGGGDQA